jgi:hypothetical protein
MAIPMASVIKEKSANHWLSSYIDFLGMKIIIYVSTLRAKISRSYGLYSSESYDLALRRLLSIFKEARHEKRKGSFMTTLAPANSRGRDPPCFSTFAITNGGPSFPLPSYWPYLLCLCFPIIWPLAFSFPAPTIPAPA